MTNGEKRFAFVAGTMILVGHLIAVVVALVTHNATIITAFLIADVIWLVYRAAQAVATKLWP